MYKIMTLTFLSEILDKMINDKVELLQIIKNENKEYSVKYKFSNEKLNSNKEKFYDAYTKLEMLFNALIADIDIDFEMFYDLNKDVTIFNASYNTENGAIKAINKSKELEKTLDKLVALSKDMELDRIVIDDLYVKIPNPSNPKRSKYKQANGDKVIQAINNLFSKGK